MNIQDTSNEQRYTSSLNYGYFDVNKFVDHHDKHSEQTSSSETDMETHLYSAIEH